MAFRVYNERRVVVRTVVLSQAGRAVVLSAMRHCSSMKLVDGLARACTECEMEALAWRVCTCISQVQQELVSLARIPVTHRLRPIPDAHLPEWSKYGVIERRHGLQVGDTKGTVVQQGIDHRADAAGLKRFRAYPFVRSTGWLPAMWQQVVEPTRPSAAASDPASHPVATRGGDVRFSSVATRRVRHGELLDGRVLTHVIR